MIENRLLSLLILLITFSLSAQIKGVVKDSVSGKPIVYAGVFSDKTHLNFSSDENGKFKTKGFQKTDTLWFFTTGYEIKKMLVKDVKKQVLLKPLESNKTDTIVEIKTEPKVWFDLKAKTDNLKAFSSTSTNIKAYYLNGNESKSLKTLIESIEIDALNFSNKRVVFKIRFFESDSLQNIGKEMQDNSIIFYIDGSYLKSITQTSPSTFFKTNTSKLTTKLTVIKEQIQLPKEGIFIAFEVMNINQNIFKLVNNSYNNILPLLQSSTTTTKTYKFEKGTWVLEDKINFLPKIKISITQEEN